MAPREHDGWEGADTHPRGDDPEEEYTEDVGAQPDGQFGVADDMSPADQWFGGGMLPPPPPYAQQAGGQSAPPPFPPAPQPSAPPTSTNGDDGTHDAGPAPYDAAPSAPPEPQDPDFPESGRHTPVPPGPIAYEPAPPEMNDDQWVPEGDAWTGTSAFPQEQSPFRSSAPSSESSGAVEKPEAEGFTSEEHAPEPLDHTDGAGAPAPPYAFIPGGDLPEAEPLPPLDTSERGQGHASAGSTPVPEKAAPEEAVYAPEPPVYAPDPEQWHNAAEERQEPENPYAFSVPEPDTAWPPSETAGSEGHGPATDHPSGSQPGYSVDLPTTEESDWRQITLDDTPDSGPQTTHASEVDDSLHDAEVPPEATGSGSSSPEQGPAPGAPSGPQPTHAPERPSGPLNTGPHRGQPPVGMTEPGPEQVMSRGWAPPPNASPYATETPYPFGGNPARPAGGPPSAPPGQNPYDWRPEGQPNAPQTGPQTPHGAAHPGGHPQAPQRPSVEPQGAPPAGGHPNPHEARGEPPQAAQSGFQGPPERPETPYVDPQAPLHPQGWGGPSAGNPPAAVPGFQYHTHFPQQGGVDPNRPETAEALDAESLVRGRRRSSKGWRKMVRSATFGIVDPGMSAAETRRRELTQRATTHVAGGHHRVAVLSLKGGVGKTTTTVALGSTLATLRGDRVLAVDANPDRGTLSDKVRLETSATIRDLLNEKEQITRYADIRGFTSQSSSRLEILASDRDPAVSEAFSEGDYRDVSRLLEHFYSICITDCGTGLLHSAMRGVLGLADQVVLVSSASVDGARSASATLDWLQAHEYGYHVRGAVVVLSMVRQGGKSSVDLNRLEEHFASRCRAVVRVPWDEHLEEGAELDLERLAPGTRDSYLQLAATVGEAFAWPS